MFILYRKANLVKYLAKILGSNVLLTIVVYQYSNLNSASYTLFKKNTLFDKSINSKFQIFLNINRRLNILKV